MIVGCLVALGVIAALIYGTLVRIADAIEAQNKHYGIGADLPPAAPEKGAA